jgi:endoglucanase
MRTTLAALATTTLVALAGCGSGGSTSSSSTSGAGGGGGGAPATDAFIRLNLVGFEPTDAKRALLMTEAKPDDSFVVEEHGAGTKGTVGASLGSWSDSFAQVAELDLAVTGGGADYKVASNGASSAFRVDDAAALYPPLLANAAFFYRAQRDGADVDASVLERKPSHLTDETASVYDPPQYSDDVLKTELTPIDATTVDVEGGWFDAGDYLKFVMTTSYVEAVMLVAERDHPAAIRAAKLDVEAAFGLAWLSKMYDDENGVLYYQVGIGDGNGKVGGDHDFWRLPEKDDARAAKKGDFDYFVEHRPVFRAAPPGQPLSPNLAGRLAADFALCSQVERGHDSAKADACLVSAAHVFELANENPSGPLLTASPHDYYPETEWRDDLELGATEIYRALASLKSPPGGVPHPASYYLDRAAHWAHQYLQVASGSDTLNLYDVSALAHRELYQAIDGAGQVSGLEVSKGDLVGDLRAQLEMGEAQGKKDPFGFGTPYGGGDASPHALGFTVTARYYRDLTHRTDFEAFRVRQRDWLFGANAWGTSFVIGAGSAFTACPQHQVANLVGTLLGAVVDGPGAEGDFQGLGGLQSGMKRCPPGGGDSFKRFSGKHARYDDNVIAWPSTEPSLDYTVLSILFFAGELS